MQRTFESLKDNDIEIIVIAYLIKHPELIDTHFEDLNNTLFANSENIKNQYLQNTENAYKQGVFGSPTFIYKDEVFWGDDRLEDCIKWINSQ